jgi:hypothetical protein
MQFCPFMCDFFSLNTQIFPSVFCLSTLPICVVSKLAVSFDCFIASRHVKKKDEAIGESYKCFHSLSSVGDIAAVWVVTLEM